MSKTWDRLQELQSVFSGASIPALANLPAGLEQDRQKARAFIDTYTRAMYFAALLEGRLAGLGRSYRVPFPGTSGPSFKELGEQHACAFLQNIRAAAARDGTVSEHYFSTQFIKQADAVRALEVSIGERNREFDIEGIHGSAAVTGSRGRRG